MIFVFDNINEFILFQIQVFNNAENRVRLLVTLLLKNQQKKSKFLIYIHIR